MKSIRLYNTTADYTADIENLPFVNVAKTKDDGKIHYMGMKKVQDHFITEEEYGTAVFDCFRNAGWINQDATYMTKAQAASITDIRDVFTNNTEIEDATFLRYFTGLTDLYGFKNFKWQGFTGCTNLKKIVIPRNISDVEDLCKGGKLEYVEILEGVTSVSALTRNSSSDEGCVVIFPSTFNGLNYNRVFPRITSTDGVLDLRNTSVTTIAEYVFYRSLGNKKVYLPSLTSIGNEFMGIIAGLEYIEFNSDTSLTIGDNCVGSNYCEALSNIIVNFKNDIPITIGNRFGYSINKKSNVIFHSTTPPTIGTYFFNTSRTSTEIYVPVGCVSAYEAVANLSNFVGRIYEIGGTEWIAAGLSQYE